MGIGFAQTFRQIASFRGPACNSIRQTDVDTSMIRTQSRVSVMYLNQTGFRHQILGGVGVRVMYCISDAPEFESYSFYPQLFLSLKIEDTLTFMNISSRNFM